MRRPFLHRLLLALALLLMPGGEAVARAPVTLLTLEGAIGPAAADYLVRGLDKAADEGAQLVVLSLDTPGGLDSAMRAIIKAILASPVPVACYVAPSGARAASAGTYLLYASHVAAMAPGTNLGAATPVQLGGLPGTPAPEPAGPNEPDADQPGGAEQPADAMSKKQVNDAAAYIRGLAQLRQRNAEWAERAVREAVSLTAEDALRLGVIEHVARDLDQLLRQLDGQTFEIAGQARRLATRDAPLIRHEPDWRTRLLGVITDPSVALILLMIGFYGLIFEFANPGTGVGGVVGGICLILGLYALQLLPVNYAGMALLLLGVACMAAEAFLPSFGVLGIGGIAAFIVGAVILIDTEVPGFGIPLSLILSLALGSALLIFAVLTMALKARRRALVGGDSELLGSLVPIAAVQPGNPLAGWVQLQGERWQVFSQTPLEPGQLVRVLARKGPRLDVAAAANRAQGGHHDGL